VDLDRFLNLLAAAFGTMGSVYVLKGIAALSPDLIERLSRSYWGFSAAQIDALCGQKADAIVGIALVLVALAITVVNLALVPTELRFVERRGVAIALVAILSGAAYIVLAFSGAAVQRHQKLAVGRIITVHELFHLFKTGKLPASEVASIKAYGRTLLELTIDDSDAPRALLSRVASAVGLSVPANFDFSEVEIKEKVR